jgi:hypothetical protein
VVGDLVNWGKTPHEPIIEANLLAELIIAKNFPDKVFSYQILGIPRLQ